MKGKIEFALTREGFEISPNVVKEVVIEVQHEAALIINSALDSMEDHDSRRKLINQISKA